MGEGTPEVMFVRRRRRKQMIVALAILLTVSIGFLFVFWYL